MTTGFQQQGSAVKFCIPKTTRTPQQVGRKLDAKPSEQRAPEPRSFR